MLSRDFHTLLKTQEFQNHTLFGGTYTSKPSLITEVLLMLMGHKLYNCLGSIDSIFLLTKICQRHCPGKLASEQNDAL